MTFRCIQIKNSLKASSHLVPISPGEALTFAKLTILGALEKLRGRTLDVWEKVKARIRSAVDEAESKARDEDCYKNIEEAVRELEDVAELNGKMVDVAEKTEQGKACELFYKLDEAGLSVKERKRILEELETIAGKSREAGEGIVEWMLIAESGRLKAIVDSGLLSEISGLEESKLKDLGEAWRLNKNIEDFDNLMKGVETALELRSEERRDRIFKLLNDFVRTGDRDKVSFLEKALGWMYRIRKSFEGGENERTNVVDWVVELAGLLYSKDVGGDDMMHVSKVMNVLADVYGDKNAYYVFPELKQQLYEDVGLKPRDPKKRSFSLNLLRDCLKKWEIALTIKDEDLHVAFQRLSDSRHQASTPMEVNYVKVGDTYIPVIATPVLGRPDYIVAIPKDAVKYFKEIGYLPGEEGFLLFVKDVPKNAKIIIPAIVEKGGKIALTEWLERFLHKNPEWREKYLDTVGGYVLNWKQLDEDHMVLVVTIRKFGAEFKEKGELEPNEYSKRTILLKPHAQNIIRTRAGDVAGADEIVLCEFELESKDVLTVEEAIDILLNQYGVREAVVKKLARRISGVMLYTDEQGEGLANTNEKGTWVEWKHVQIIQKHDEILEYQKEIEGTIIDFVTESNLLIDAKFRKRLVEMEMEDLLKQMAAYKKEWEKYEARNIRAKVVFSFERKLSDSDYEFLESKIEERFGKSWEEWLKICNGINEFETFLRKYVGK